MAGKWFNIWYEYTQSIIDTMIKNMHSDLEAGYNPLGLSIRKQREVIDERQREFNLQMEEFKYMSDYKINKWCMLDLKIRGAIE